MNNMITTVYLSINKINQRILRNPPTPPHLKPRYLLSPEQVVNGSKGQTKLVSGFVWSEIISVICDHIIHHPFGILPCCLFRKLSQDMTKLNISSIYYLYVRA